MPQAKLHPKVSIVIPVYNGSDFLQEAIDSALNQTYEKIEVIVVNDGSNDGGRTEEIAKSYRDRIRYFYKENGGVASALNRGIVNMTGEYFSWLSHDDVYFSNKIEEQVKFLQVLDRDNVVLYSDFQCIDENSEFLKEVNLNHIDPKSVLPALLHNSFIHGCTVMIPKKCLLDDKPFNENLKTTQDYDLWFRLAIDYDFFHIEKVLIKSRIHSNQGCRTYGRLHKKECNDFFVYSMKKLAELDTRRPILESRSLFFARLSFSLMKRGFFFPAILSILKSIKSIKL